MRRWPWLLLSILVVPCSGIVGVPLAIEYTIADHADQGAGCPACAAMEWEDTFGMLYRDQDGQIRAENIAAPSRRAALVKQRADYLALVQRDTPDDGPGNSNFEDAYPDRDQLTVTGNRASLVRQIGISWLVIDPSTRESHLGGAIEATAWTYDIRFDGRGWHIWSVTMPPWCEAYSSCGKRPPVTASPSPSPTDDDPLNLNDLASKLPCAPADPLRNLRSCPPTDSPS